MKKLILFGMCITALEGSFASVDSYYPTSHKNIFEAGSQQEMQLKESLFQVLSSFHRPSPGSADQLVENCQEGSKDQCYRQKSLSYQQARTYLFGQLHLKEDQNGVYLEDVYCNRRLRDGEHNGNLKVGSMIVPSNQFINCEHTWPQSRFSGKFPKELQKTDLHHLFPTDTAANSERGNIPFGENIGQPLRDCSASSKGRLASGSGSYYFAPPTEHRGNVARALFYFSVRYKIPIDAVQERYLRQWHRDDPVDASEIERNDQIEELQWNRNPFIDFPHLVASISDF